VYVSVVCVRVWSVCVRCVCGNKSDDVSGRD